MRRLDYSSPNVSLSIERGVKRWVDVFFAGLFLIVFSPGILLIALCIKLESPGPIFYSHERIGKDGRPFRLLKFRSMTVGGDDGEYMEYLKQLIESDQGDSKKGIPYRKMEGDPRITRVGGFLRKYYLDELPQFWNIVKGEMSLVGPRPHVQFEVDYYTAEQCRRLSVRPGATGLWQVKGKADCTFSELIALDLEYIDNWSLGEDIRIIFSTILLMVRGGEGFWARMAKHVPGWRDNYTNNNHTNNDGKKASSSVAKEQTRAYWVDPEAKPKYSKEPE
jgi:lipopolysaccharide/colanic/teichoic acid biosynthesis glycosyltransferase